MQKGLIKIFTLKYSCEKQTLKNKNKLFFTTQVRAQVIQKAPRTMPAYGTCLGTRVHSHHHIERSQPEHMVQQAHRPHTEDAATTAVGFRDQGEKTNIFKAKIIHNVWRRIRFCYKTKIDTVFMFIVVSCNCFRSVFMYT